MQPAHRGAHDVREDGDPAVGEEEIRTVGEERRVSEALDGGKVDGCVVHAVVIALHGNGEEREQKQNECARDRPLESHAEDLSPGLVRASHLVLLTSNSSVGKAR